MTDFVNNNREYLNNVNITSIKELVDLQLTIGDYLATNYSQKLDNFSLFLARQIIKISQDSKNNCHLLMLEYLNDNELFTNVQPTLTNRERNELKLIVNTLNEEVL